MIPAIAVTDVTKTYSSGAVAVHALRGVSLDVAPGEIVLLLGPSGSGKTTLLSIMGCILRASGGSVKVQGREVAHLAERDLPQVRLQHFGFVFQGFNLFPALTAGENVEIALGLKGVGGRSARRQAAEALDLVGLADKVDVQAGRPVGRPEAARRHRARVGGRPVHHPGRRAHGGAGFDQRATRDGPAAVARARAQPSRGAGDARQPHVPVRRPSGSDRGWVAGRDGNRWSVQSILEALAS